MGFLEKLKRTVWSDAPVLTTEGCPWCGRPVERGRGRILPDDRRYHPECAVACLNAGMLSDEGGGPGRAA
jgi:hypothetical protein